MTNFSIFFSATKYELVFQSSAAADDSAPEVLIPVQCPIPVRKSHALPKLAEGVTEVAVAISVKTDGGDLKEVAKVRQLFETFIMMTLSLSCADYLAPLFEVIEHTSLNIRAGEFSASTMAELSHVTFKQF